MATIKDVARLSGVSISTVSIVLNGQSTERKIPQSTQKEVLKAVSELNYQPNLSARKLRSAGKDEYTVGVYWASDTRTIILARVLQGLQKAISESDKTIKTVICPFTTGKLHEDRSLRSITSYNAVIIATINDVDLAYLEQNPPPIPTVLFNRYSKNFSGVGTDNRIAGQLAADQLLEQGITDIGCVHHKASFLAMRQRSDSFREHCTAHGIAIPDQNVVYTDDTIAGGFLAGEELLRREKIPKGIYCDDDQLALGLISAIHQHGLKIPEDVKLVAMGMGPPDFCRHSIPPITVVELPIEEMAQGALKLTMDILEHRVETPHYLDYPSTLYVRESSRCTTLEQD